jgi:hypothetical protein
VDHPERAGGVNWRLIRRPGALGMLSYPSARSGSPVRFPERGGLGFLAIDLFAGDLLRYRSSMGRFRVTAHWVWLLNRKTA